MKHDVDWPVEGTRENILVAEWDDNVEDNSADSSEENLPQDHQWHNSSHR